MSHHHELDWADFKAKVDTKDLIIQCSEITRDGVDYYDLHIDEQGDAWYCRLTKATPAPDPSDQKDFEDNYAAHANQRMAVPLDPVGVERWRLAGHGVVGICTAGGDKTLDFVMPETLWVKGALVMTKDAELGDWAEAHVYHPNGTTLIATFIHKWYANEMGEITIDTEMAAQIPTGFIMRVIYHSTGVTDVGVAVNYKFYKKL
jgi:hypothetical protein